MSSSLFEDVCQDIIGLDKMIRFAGIANMRRTIVSAKYRDGIGTVANTRRNDRIY